MSNHQVALWAGVASFFGSLLALSIIDYISARDAVQLLGSLLVAIITAGSVYAKQRLDDAKEEQNRKQ